jgi:predicted GNAT family acetyltransferase
VFAGGNQRELGVATVMDQRGKGLATLVTAACLEHCQANGFQPNWHCLDENTASWLIAEKIGFYDAVHYEVIRIHL